MSIPRTRTRGFTGCYTCRERKLKCDDTKPVCMRCVSLGIRCRGYGIKLSWMPHKGTVTKEKAYATGSYPRTVDEALSRRPLYTGIPPYITSIYPTNETRNLDLERKSMSLKTEQSLCSGERRISVNQAITEIDTRSFNLSEDSKGIKDGVRIGPFGAFSYAHSLNFDQNSKKDDPGWLQHSQSTSCLSTNDTTKLSKSSYATDSPDTTERETASIQPNNPEAGTETYFDSVDDLFASAQIGFEEFMGDFASNFDTLDCSSEDTGNMFTMAVNQPWKAQEARTEAMEEAETSFAIRQAIYSLDSSRHRMELPVSISNTKNIFVIPTEARFLLEHYSSEVIEFMCLLPNSSSPWRTIHLPCAMSTMADLVVFGKATHARMALFYALLAVSSYHLASKMSRSMSSRRAIQDESILVSLLRSGQHGTDTNSGLQYWQERGLEFRALSVSHLQASLQEDEYNSLKEYKELLMSSLSMVTISVTSGDMGDAHRYLMQAERLIKLYRLSKFAKSKHKSNKVTALHQIFFYLRIIESSTFVSCFVAEESPRLSSQHPHNPEDSSQEQKNSTSSQIPGVSTPFLDNLNTLEEDDQETEPFASIYGVPRDLLSLISVATDLGNEIDRRQPQEPYLMADMDFVQRCQNAEDRICNWKLPDVTPSTDHMPSNSEVAFSLIASIHNALVVMFFRRVRKVNSMIVQHYIQTAADYLVQHEELKLRAGINASPLAWPWFIVACEATNKAARERLLLWVGFARRYGMRSLETAEQIVEEVWRRLDEHLPNATWVEVIREWGTNLVLT